MSNIIYVDILFITNAIIGYFTLQASGKLSGEARNTTRIIMGAVAAGFSAMIIFVHAGELVLWIYKFSTAALICLISFGAKRPRMFLKLFTWYLLLNFALAGTVFAIQYYFSPQGMQISNFTVYINVSPIVLLLSVLCVYLAVNIICLIFARPQQNIIAGITFTLADKLIKCNALVDSGFNVKDAISGRDVFLVAYSDVKHLLPSQISQMLLLYLTMGKVDEASHLHLICVHTATGTKALPAVKADSITVSIGDKSATFNNVLAAFTSETLGGGSFSAIVGINFAQNCL